MIMPTIIVVIVIYRTNTIDKSTNLDRITYLHHRSVTKCKPQDFHSNELPKHISFTPEILRVTYSVVFGNYDSQLLHFIL